jgi:hypothetical protein
MKILGAITLALVAVVPAAAAGEPQEFQLHTRPGIGVSSSEKIFGIHDDPVGFIAPGLMESSQLGLRLLGGFTFFLELTTISRPMPLGTLPVGLPFLDGSAPFGVIVGAGVGRFLWESGPYVSAAFGVSADEVTVVDGSPARTSPWDNGVGFSVRVDRTWWAGEHMRVTVAGQFLYMANQDPLDADRATSTWGLGGLVFISYGDS